MCVAARSKGWRRAWAKARTRCNSFISTWVRCDMTSQAKTAEQIESTILGLKSNSVFGDLPEADLAWLAERMDEVRLNVGEVYARAGDPLDHLTVMLEGEMHIERPEDQGSPMFMASAGQVTGLLPFSRLTKYKGTGR